MKNIAISFIILLVTWLLLSGVYKPLILALGFLSIFITIYFVRRMETVDSYDIKLNLNLFKFFMYFLWLLAEIMKSNIQVVKAIIKGDNSLNKKMFYQITSQKSDIGKVIFANSITLTPGTISVHLDEKGILVHALNFQQSDLKGLKDMDEKVSETEG